MTTHEKLLKDIKLLEQSCKHWQEIVLKFSINMEELPQNIGPEYCALCRDYNKRAYLDHYTSEEHKKEMLEVSCKECPIYLKTGKQFCEDTSERDYENTDDGDLDKWEQLESIAEEELQFLRELLGEYKERLKNE
jgi:hypothetical protein